MTEQYPAQETRLTPPPTAEQLLAAGSELLEHFGVQGNLAQNPDQSREVLRQLNPRAKGDRTLVRWELENNTTQWPEETTDIIMRTAERMDMLKPETPLRGDFDVVIALGGARKSNLDRLRYAAEAIKTGEASAKQLIVAGSSRTLREEEQKAVADYAPGAQTEFDLCAAAAATAAKENPGLAISLLLVEDEKAGTPAVIETVLRALQQNGTLPDGAKVAAVTTQIYQASTQCDLDRVAAQFGVAKTYTAGNPSDPNVVAKRTPATYLTEVLRTLRAAVDYTEARDQMTAAAEKQMQEARAAQLERELRYIAEHPELGLEPYGNGNYIGPDGWSVYRFDDGSSEPYILGTEETIDFWA